ncbi:hypothetical protein B9T24_14225 [Acinetobacter sp. ANC 4654]|uniref:hypothetical protein n=1 Tax=Acinetobacter sp. ANC 4654 TaxID=1977872 RepID=UPI000A331190|nr:hypothetical protein [Acinetobacter sp. ANC 4654]OTG93622.1 hypothetical protein B9T24_14225 [Acinetobacter sp. ANC 4654]
MSILDKNYVVEMEDNSKWAVPVRIIAEHRAKYFAKKDGISLEESLNDDTVPLFESNDYEIHDWAANNLNFSDVQHVAKQIGMPDVDYEDGWANGEYEIQEQSHES